MRIGDLSRQTGIPARMLRYYEEQGLLNPARDASGYRSYADCDVGKVRQIRGLLDSGLPTEIIRRILPFLDSPDQIHLPPQCLTEQTTTLLRDEIARLNARIECLDRNRGALTGYLDAILPPEATKDLPRPLVCNDGTVRRQAGPWTPTVHALLNHLESVGFGGSQRVVGTGYDERGWDVVSYIPGDFVHPHSWSDEGIWQVGRLLRELHGATATFRPPADAVWHQWPFHRDAPDAIISHRDAGPWNIVAREGLPVAFIDWPTAGPTDRMDEIAQTAWLNAQLHDDDIAEHDELPGPAARAAQLRLFADGYGLAAPDRAVLVSAMIEYAIRDSAAEAVQGRVTIDGGGEITSLWPIAWRARSAAWMIRHRALLERALS